MRRKLIPLACTLAVLATPLAAEAATLLVEGPAGAVLRLDGRGRATLPMGQPIPVEPGEYALVVELDGYEDHRQFLLVEGEEEVVLQVELLPLERMRAVGYSLLLAGTGQLYQGRRSRGWGYLGLQLASVAGFVAGEAWLSSRRDDFELAMEDYRAAVAPGDIAAARAEASAASDDMESAESIRNLAAGVAIGLAVLSAADAWWTHGRIVPGEARAASLPGRGLGLGWGWSW